MQGYKNNRLGKKKHHSSCKKSEKILLGKKSWNCVSTNPNTEKDMVLKSVI